MLALLVSGCTPFRPGVPSEPAASGQATASQQEMGAVIAQQALARTRQLLAEKAAGPRRLLRGLELTGRGVPRGHMRVYAGDTAVGETTSGTFLTSMSRAKPKAMIWSSGGKNMKNNVARSRNITMNSL